MEEIVQAKLDICEIFKQNISLNRKKIGKDKPILCDKNRYIENLFVF